MPIPGLILPMPIDIDPTLVTFDDIDEASSGSGENADKQYLGFTIPILYRATLSSYAQGGGVGTRRFAIYRNGVLADIISPTLGAQLNITLYPGDNIHFQGTVTPSGRGWNGVVALTNQSKGGASLGFFNVVVSMS